LRRFSHEAGIDHHRRCPVDRHAEEQVEGHLGTVRDHRHLALGIE